MRVDYVFNEMKNIGIINYQKDLDIILKYKNNGTSVLRRGNPKAKLPIKRALYLFNYLQAIASSELENYDNPKKLLQFHRKVLNYLHPDIA